MTWGGMTRGGRRRERTWRRYCELTLLPNHSRRRSSNLRRFPSLQSMRERSAEVRSEGEEKDEAPLSLVDVLDILPDPCRISPWWIRCLEGLRGCARN